MNFMGKTTPLETSGTNKHIIRLLKAVEMMPEALQANYSSKIRGLTAADAETLTSFMDTKQVEVHVRERMPITYALTNDHERDAFKLLNSLLVISDKTEPTDIRR